MIIRKTINYLFIATLFFLNFNIAYAKNGSGEVKMSIRAASAFYDYLNNKKGRPMFFALHPEGEYFSFWYCPHSYAQGCDMTKYRDLIRQCDDWAKENNVSGNCFMFAKKSSIVWKNSANKKRLKVPKKLSEDQLKQFLLKNKFLTADINTPTFNLDNPDLVEKLKGLKKLYDQGALTKNDFDRAKKAILKK